MTVKKPFISVVMPTYNRGHLIGDAIKSILRQTFEDFELIVSNSASTDNTREVVTGFDDKRVKYIESDKKLVIGDNYQIALDNAKGEYITFLSDDDAFTPITFERVKQIIDTENARLVGFQVSYYYHDTVTEIDLTIPPKTLVFRDFTRDVTRFTSQNALQNLFASYKISNGTRNAKFITPFLANAFYHNSIFEKLKQKTNKLFNKTPADMYLAAAVFYQVEHYFCIDEPLHVWSFWEGNSSASPNKKGKKLREHYENLLKANDETLELTPVKFALPYNCIINSILSAKQNYETENNRVNLDWNLYFVETYKYLQYISLLGVDTNHEMAEFRDVLNQQPNDVKQTIKKQIDKPIPNLKQFLRKNFPGLRKAFSNLLNKPSRSELSDIYIDGNKNGFSNFLEASQYLAKKLNETKTN